MRIPRREFVVVGGLLVSGCVTRIEDRLTGDWGTKKEIVSIYESGIGPYNDGVEGLEAGINYEDWAEVAKHSKPSLAAFDTAQSRFTTAGALCEEINEDNAQAICMDAAAKSDWMIKITNKVIEAARAFSRGEEERGDALWQEYKRYREQSKATRVRSSATLSRALNLPTD